MTMVRLLLALLVGLSLHLVCHAQNDTVRVQNLPLKNHKTPKNLYKTDSVTSKVRNPRKATLYSTFVPGMGQIYNRKYWKAPIVWAAVGIPVYTFLYNRSWYNKTQRAIYLLDIYLDQGLPFTTNPDTLKMINSKLLIFTSNGDDNDLRTYRNEFRKDEDYSVLFFLLFWGLNVVDATVDAHLSSFDISPSLTMRVDQRSGGFSASGPGGNGMGMGLSLVFDWHKPKFKPLTTQ